MFLVMRDARACAKDAGVALRWTKKEEVKEDQKKRRMMRRKEGRTSTVRRRGVYG